MKKIKGTLEEMEALAQRIAQGLRDEFGTQCSTWAIPFQKNGQKWYLPITEDIEDLRKVMKYLTHEEKLKLEDDPPDPPPPPPPPEDPPVWPIDN